MDIYLERPSYAEIARETKVCHAMVQKFMMEFECHGKLSDPKEKKWVKAHCHLKSDGVYGVLTLEQEEF